MTDFVSINKHRKVNKRYIMDVLVDEGVRVMTVSYVYRVRSGGEWHVSPDLKGYQQEIRNGRCRFKGMDVVEDEFFAVLQWDHEKKDVIVNKATRDYMLIDNIPHTKPIIQLIVQDFKEPVQIVFNSRDDMWNFYHKI